mmetsp:Transcript_22835/g.71580  ORF Transcript_22835/g.71580 Transcript_22835/m.71580 type:complete len:168 (+) Transcript_22835:569-1072(+)
MRCDGQTDTRGVSSPGSRLRLLRPVAVRLIPPLCSQSCFLLSNTPFPAVAILPCSSPAATAPTSLLRARRRPGPPQSRPSLLSRPALRLASRRWRGWLSQPAAHDPPRPGRPPPGFRMDGWMDGRKVLLLLQFWPEVLRDPRADRPERPARLVRSPAPPPTEQLLAC